MKKMCVFAAVITIAFQSIAQAAASVDTSGDKQYRETATRINDLVHTKLDVKFDFDKSYLYGKAWITLKPHFYSTDSFTLDAKGMDIKRVALNKGTVSKDLKFVYDGWQLRINLDKTYKSNEEYIIYIDYVSTKKKTGDGSL